MILTDFDADILDRLTRRPHPTIPEAELAALDKALRDVTGKARLNLRANERLIAEGRSFEQARDHWRGRLERLAYVRIRLNDARVRHEDVDLGPLWQAVEAVREKLHERIGVA